MRVLIFLPKPTYEEIKKIKNFNSLMEVEIDKWYEKLSKISSSKKNIYSCKFTEALLDCINLKIKKNEKELEIYLNNEEIKKLNEMSYNLGRDNVLFFLIRQILNKYNKGHAIFYKNRNSLITQAILDLILEKKTENNKNSY